MCMYHRITTSSLLLVATTMFTQSGGGGKRAVFKVYTYVREGGREGGSGEQSQVGESREARGV